MCSIDDMLVQLKSSRQLITKQIDVLSEVTNKSNNILLQMEMERSKEINMQQDISNLKAYSYEKKCEQSFAKAVELFQNLPFNEHHSTETASEGGFAEYIHHNYQNLDFLNSNVRKLFVIREIMGVVTDKNEVNE